MEKKQDRVEKSLQLFKSGYNCAQSLAVAFCDVTKMDEAQAAELTKGMEGGKQGFCGAYLGAKIVAEHMGLNDFEAKLAEQFEKTAGSSQCRQIKANKFSCADCVTLGAKALSENLFKD